jgi:hypothetical protein
MVTVSPAGFRAIAPVRLPAVRLLVVALSGLAVLLAAVLLTTVPYGRSIWDFLFVLDGAYRISLGQVPHVDFASPVGSLTLYLTLAAERLFPAGNPFVGLHAVVWLAALPVVALLAPRFRSGLGFAAAIALLALTMLVPVTLDSTHLSEISYFASYNRFASGFLFLVGLWFVLPKSRYDGLMLAYVLAFLFFLKITAAATAIGILLAAVILGRARARVLLSAFAGLAVVLALVEIASGMVSAYLQDIRAMGAINQGRAVYALFFSAFRNWAPLAAAAALALVALQSLVRLPGLSPRRPLAFASALLARESFAIDACLLVAAALFAESQNTGGLGLIAAAALFFHPGAWKGEAPRTLVTALLAAALVLPVLDIVVKRSLTAAVRERTASDTSLIGDLLPGTRVPLATAEGARLFTRITAEWLDLAREIQAAGFFLDPDPTTNAPAARLAWAESAVEAGRAFEERGYRDAAARYATLAFADPFARMLRLTPAHGTTIAAEIGRTVPLFTVEGAARYLADADGVFVSRCEIGGDATNDDAFQAVLDAEFEPLPLHPCWDFYRRTAAAPARGEE